MQEDGKAKKSAGQQELHEPRTDVANPAVQDGPLTKWL
jgi:hypothetical protein